MFRMGAVCAMAHMWRSEDNYVESILSFGPYVGSGDQTQFARFAEQALVPTEPSHQSSIVFLR